MLLIYGFMATRRSFEVMEARLRRDGYCVFSINLGGLAETFNTKSIDQTARHIARKIDRLYARHSLGPLSIIGHSKGGLIARLYVQSLGGHQRVRTVITLGTPHQGTPSAYFGVPFAPWARSILQMTPLSPFIRELAQAPFPPSVYMASVWSRLDRVCPYPSAVIDAEGRPNMANVEVDANHHDMLVKRKVYQGIHEHLLAGEAWSARFDPSAHPAEVIRLSERRR